MIQLMQGDCMELLKEVPDNSINMILCDLPYEETGNQWDNVLDMKELFNHYRRILVEDGCIALTGTMKFGMQMYSVAPDLYKYEWVWEKDNGTNVPNIHYQPFRVHEYIFIFGKGRVTNGNRTPMKYYPQMAQGTPYQQTSGRISDNWKGSLGNIVTSNESGQRYPKSIQKFNRDKTSFHPTQKPVAMLEYLIRTYTDEGDTVLDNCMGSGSTGVACKNLNRNFIGMELTEKYFNIAKQRVEQGDKSILAERAMEEKLKSCSQPLF